MRQARTALALSARVLFAFALLALGGCSTIQPVAPAAVAPRPACLAVKAYTSDQLQALAAAVRAVPPDSPLRVLVVDYERLRDEASAACGGR